MKSIQMIVYSYFLMYGKVLNSIEEKKIKQIEPKFNRVVIFNTTSLSFHGQPEPINCPKYISRNVFSAFYYSPFRDKNTSKDPHFTKYDIKNNPYAKNIIKDYKKNY